MNFKILSLAIFSLSTLKIFSQLNTDTISTDPLGGLVEIVIENYHKNSSSVENLQTKTSLLDLTNIIIALNSERSGSLYGPNEILSYLIDIYSDHDYHESGDWAVQLPVSGSLTSAYGYRNKFHRVHQGIDIAIKEGMPVKSALKGKVVKIGFDPSGYGLYVVVEHEGNIQTLYGHLKTCLTTNGASVHKGQVIGLSGSSGNSTGPHLHFETRKNGVTVDPFSLFNFNELSK